LSVKINFASWIWRAKIDVNKSPVGHSLFHLLLPSQSVLRRVRIIAKNSICLSASMQQLDSHWTHFYEKRNVIIFRKSVEKIQALLKSDKNKEYFTECHVNVSWYLVEFLLGWEMFKKMCVEKIKIHNLSSIFFWKWCHICDSVEKYCTVRQAIYGNIVPRRDNVGIQTHS
jgi:hypothetical protein